jgi:hypothetical protein
MPSLLNVEFLPILLKIGLTGVSVLVVCAVCWLVILGVLRLIRVKNQREHSIQITNQGNVPSTYHLSTASRENWLNFRIFSNGVPLVELPTQAPPVSARRQARSASRQPGFPNTQAVGAQAQNLMESGKAASSTAGTAASLLGTIGSILPGSAGKALKEQSAAVRNVQVKTSHAIHAPEEAKTKMSAIQKDSSRLGIKGPGSGAAPRKDAQSVGMQPPAPAAFAGSPPVQAAIPSRFGYWVETSEVRPGESLRLTLQITPKSRNFKEGSYAYTLTSQQMAVQNVNKEAVPITRSAVVYLKPVAVWRYWLRLLISTACGALGLLALVFIVGSTWK